MDFHIKTKFNDGDQLWLVLKGDTYRDYRIVQVSINVVEIIFDSAGTHIYYKAMLDGKQEIVDYEGSLAEEKPKLFATLDEAFAHIKELEEERNGQEENRRFYAKRSV